jgi:predicted transcriptional regulator
MEKVHKFRSLLPTPQKLKELRIIKGISQAVLGELAGLSQSQIARMETGTVNPRIGTVEKVLRILEETDTIEETKNAKKE